MCADNVVLLRDGDFVGQLVRPDILVDLLHGHGFEHVASERPNDADMRQSTELLAHVPSVHRGLQAVDYPIGREPLYALVEVWGHLELEIPLMVAGVQFVRLGLAADVDGKEVEFFDQKVCLLCNGLRAYGVGQVPSGRAKLACGLEACPGRGATVRNFPCAGEGDSQTPHGHGLWVVQDQLALELRLMRLGRFSIEDNKRRVRPAEPLAAPTPTFAVVKRT